MFDGDCDGEEDDKVSISFSVHSFVPFAIIYAPPALGGTFTPLFPGIHACNALKCLRKVV